MRPHSNAPLSHRGIPSWLVWILLITGLPAVLVGQSSGIRLGTGVDFGTGAGPVTVSRSGQFIVHGQPGASSAARVGSPSQFKPVGDRANIVLRADLLAVISERVRLAVNTQLGISDSPGAKIHLYLRRRRQVEGQIDIVPAAFSGGFVFKVELPEEIEWYRLVRALVEVSLLDLANRGNPRSDCVVLPLWFSEGMNSVLIHEYGRDLVPEAETLLNRSARRKDPIAAIRAALGGNEPESFGDLTQAGLGQFTDPARFDLYRANVALLVAAWVQDDEGRRHAQQFLRILPSHLNWQTAFLRSSGGRFDTFLDVEKWWAVALVSMLSRDPSQQWPRDRVVTELRWIMAETAELRETTNSPAARRTVTLSEIVRSWEYPAQREVLTRKATQLQRLAVHAPPDLVPLLAECFQTLDGYLTSRSGAGVDPISRTDIESRGRVLAKTTSRKLDRLERQIAARP